MSKFRVTCVLTIWISIGVWAFLSLYYENGIKTTVPSLHRLRSFLPLVALIILSVSIIWVNRCSDCKRRIIWADPESEKVCRNCDIVRALTGKNKGDWNST